MVICSLCSLAISYQLSAFSRFVLQLTALVFDNQFSNRRFLCCRSHMYQQDELKAES
jgi:hypothetical protein